MPEVAPQGQLKRQYAPIIAGVGAALLPRHREMPSEWHGMAENRSDLGFWKTEIFFQKGLDTQTANAAPDCPQARSAGLSAVVSTRSQLDTSAPHFVNRGSDGVYFSGPSRSTGP